MVKIPQRLCPKFIQGLSCRKAISLIFKDNSVITTKEEYPVHDPVEMVRILMKCTDTFRFSRHEIFDCLKPNIFRKVNIFAESKSEDKPHPFRIVLTDVNNHEIEYETFFFHYSNLRIPTRGITTVRTPPSIVALQYVCDELFIPCYYIGYRDSDNEIKIVRVVVDDFDKQIEEILNERDKITTELYQKTVNGVVG